MVDATFGVFIDRPENILIEIFISLCLLPRLGSLFDRFLRGERRCKQCALDVIQTRTASVFIAYEDAWLVASHFLGSAIIRS